MTKHIQSIGCRNGYAPYYDYTKTPALSPDAPDEAVKAYQKQQELFKRKYAEAEALFFSNGDN